MGNACSGGRFLARSRLPVNQMYSADCEAFSLVEINASRRIDAAAYKNHAVVAWE